MRAERQRDIQAILDGRAKTLAAREAESQAAETRELATFAVGGHFIGVPSRFLVRAAPLMHVTEIPGAPPHLVGLTAVDGHMVSLLDLPLLCALGRRGVGDITASLLVGVGGREIGLAAEQLFGIEDIPEVSVVALPGSGALRELARLSKRSLLILDVEALFADPRLGDTHG